MNNTIVIVLEETLTQLMAEYQQQQLGADIAAAGAYNVELKVRAMAELIERESNGQYSQEKILKKCGLKEKQS